MNPATKLFQELYSFGGFEFQMCNICSLIPVNGTNSMQGMKIKGFYFSLHIPEKIKIGAIAAIII